MIRADLALVLYVTVAAISAGVLVALAHRPLDAFARTAETILPPALEAASGRLRQAARALADLGAGLVHSEVSARRSLAAALERYLLFAAMTAPAVYWLATVQELARTLGFGEAEPAETLRIPALALLGLAGLFSGVLLAAGTELRPRFETGDYLAWMFAAALLGFFLLISNLSDLWDGVAAGELRFGSAELRHELRFNLLGLALISVAALAVGVWAVLEWAVMTSGLLCYLGAAVLLVCAGLLAFASAVLRNRLAFLRFLARIGGPQSGSEGRGT